MQSSPSFHTLLPGPPIAEKIVAVAPGAVITYDCDYSPRTNNVRNRPPAV